MLWELLTGETPYRDVDQAAIIYGVGTNSLHLPLPTSVPAGFLLLMRMCWDPKPRNRPSFSSILLHLSIASAELVAQDPDQYVAQQLNWKKEVRSRLNHISNNSSAGSATSDQSNSNHHQQQQSDRRRHRRSSNNNQDEDPEALMRIAELRHVEDIRALYEEKLERVNHLYNEMASLKAILQEQAKNKSKYYFFFNYLMYFY